VYRHFEKLYHVYLPLIINHGMISYMELQDI
jgi:hypothetical protein